MCCRGEDTLSSGTQARSPLADTWSYTFQRVGILCNLFQWLAWYRMRQQLPQMAFLMLPGKPEGGLLWQTGKFFLTKQAAVFLPPFFVVAFALSILDGSPAADRFSVCVLVSLCFLCICISFCAWRGICLSAFRYISVCNKCRGRRTNSELGKLSQDQKRLGAKVRPTVYAAWR